MFELVSKKMDVPGNGMDDHTLIYTSLSTSSSSLKHSLSSIDIIQPKFMVIDSLHRAHPPPQNEAILSPMGQRGSLFVHVSWEIHIYISKSSIFFTYFHK